LLYLVLSFVSLALLLAVVALVKERRLRLALQQILRTLIERWRNYAHWQDRPTGDCDPDDPDHGGLQK
jgi:hypothetical protein